MAYTSAYPLHRATRIWPEAAKGRRLRIDPGLRCPSCSASRELYRACFYPYSWLIPGQPRVRTRGVCRGAKERGAYQPPFTGTR